MSQKRVLITSNGDELSLNLAFNLLKNGCRIVLAGNKSLLTEASDKLMSGFNGEKNVGVVDIDVNGNNESVVVEEAVNQAWGILGRIDALVHCLSYEGELVSPLELSEQELNKIVKVNIKITWLVCKALARKMREHISGGSFVLLTSIIGTERGLYPGSAVYGACLAGVNHLARSLALELGKHKIRVNAVARGLHSSDIFVETVNGKSKEEMAGEIVPLKRWLDKHNDLTSLVHYLIHDDSSFITGTVIFADGGQSIVRPRMRSYM